MSTADADQKCVTALPPAPARRGDLPRPRTPDGRRDARTTDLAPSAWDAGVTDLLREGLVLHGADGRIERTNRAAAELLGRTDLVGLDGLQVWGATLGPQGRPVTDAENPLRVALVTGLVSERVVGVPGADGDVSWLTVRAIPMSADGGGPGSDDVRAPDAIAVTISRPDVDGEVADRRDRDHLLSVAQRMARLSVWRYRLGDTGVQWLDGDGRGMGIAGEQKTMQDYLDGIHPEDRPAHDQMLGALFAGQETAEVDIRYRWEDGWRHWHMWAESVVDADGTVTGLWGTTQEVTDRREAEAAVRRLTMTDSLTELANRAQAEELLHEALSRRSGHEGAGLLLVDVDRFHAVNDRYGHPVGDALLVELGRRLAAVDLPGCTAARVGGNEFGVVLERTTAADAERLAHRLHRELTQPYRLSAADQPVVASISIGVTVVDETSPVGSSELYRQAELSAAAAKVAGGDRVVVFDAELRSRTVTRQDMESRLRTALADNTVLPVYQPIIKLGASVADDRVRGCEALARMTVDGMTIPPLEFVPVAEATGLIVDLDVAVFTHAVEQVLRQPLVPDINIAVNLSPLSLQVAGLAERISAVLGSNGASQLRFEITEGSLAEPTPTLVENLRGLRELGGRIGLDDFGTGYSALSYLRRFDLDFMKIDRSFVADVCRDRRSAAVVRAVIELAHAHDLFVIAEGVETADQLEALRAMQCDLVQGFHLGRPMTVADLAARVTA